MSPVLLFLCLCSAFEISKLQSQPRPRAIELDTSLIVTDASIKRRIHEGREIAKVQASPCWTETKAHLVTVQCNTLRSEGKERLTIALTNCHLERTGNPVIECDTHTPVGDCLKRLGRDETEKQYSAYTMFQLYFDEFCFSARREAFQEDTQRAVSGLYAATLETSTNLQSLTRHADEARVQLTSMIQTQQSELRGTFDALQLTQREQFQSLSQATTNLDKQQNTLHQKSQVLYDVLAQSLVIQQDVQSNQSSLLEQFGKANQTLLRLERQQESALALVQSTTENLKQLSSSQRNAFAETNQSLAALAQQQTSIDTLMQKSLESSSKLSAEQAMLFELLVHQKLQLETGQQNLLALLSTTKENLNELSATQRASFENAAQQFTQIASTTSAFAQDLHAQLDGAKKSQERTLQQVSDGFAGISTSQNKIQQRQDQLLQNVNGTHQKLAELQRKNEDSFEAASAYLASLRLQSQQAEERVHKVMVGFEKKLEDGFQRLLNLDHSILGELFTIKAIVFYASCSVALFLCTTAKQTRRLRPYLLLAIVINYYIESHAFHLAEWLVVADHALVVSWLRKTFLLGVSCSLILSAWKFKDYRALSYEVALQNQQLLRALTQHMRRRAARDNVDSSDLDAALSTSRQVKRERSAILSSSFFSRSNSHSCSSSSPSSSSTFPSTSPPTPALTLLPLTSTATTTSSAATTSALQEPTSRDENSPSNDVEQVAEEPESIPTPAPTDQSSEDDTVEEDLESSSLAEEPRCTAIAKSSGLQCKNSARTCHAHRLHSK